MNLNYTSSSRLGFRRRWRCNMSLSICSKEFLTTPQTCFFCFAYFDVVETRSWDCKSANAKPSPCLISLLVFQTQEKFARKFGICRKTRNGGLYTPRYHSFLVVYRRFGGWETGTACLSAIPFFYTSTKTNIGSIFMGLFRARDA
jgi:hypothetical protein